MVPMAQPGTTGCLAAAQKAKCNSPNKDGADREVEARPQPVDILIRREVVYLCQTAIFCIYFEAHPWQLLEEDGWTTRVAVTEDDVIDDSIKLVQELLAFDSDGYSLERRASWNLHETKLRRSLVTTNGPDNSPVRPDREALSREVGVIAIKNTSWGRHFLVCNGQVERLARPLVRQPLPPLNGASDRLEVQEEVTFPWAEVLRYVVARHNCVTRLREKLALLQSDADACSTFSRYYAPGDMQKVEKLTCHAPCGQVC